MLKKAIRRYFYKMAKVHLNRSNYSNDLEYYRDVTFVKSLIIIHPYTILPVILGVDYGYRIGSMPIVYWASFTYMMLILISLPSRLTIYQRKLILTIGIFNFGFQLMIDSGMDASGILYWTIGNMMASLFFKRNNYLLILVLNSCMSIFIGVIIYFKSSSPFFSQSLSIADWLLIAANNIFLSTIIAILFTELVQSLHQIIIKQRQLKKKYEINVQSIKKSKELLLVKNKELEQMAYVISHDLQEPIRMIISFLGRLIDKYKTQITDGNKRLIIESVSKANNIKRIVNDLLELSLLNIESQTKEVIQLEKLTHQLFIQKDISQVPTVAIEENKSLYTYEKPIRKIIDNLIDNSISKNKSTANINISISCISSNGYWVIAYHDKAFVFETATKEDFSVLNYDHFLEDFGLDITISKLLIDQLNGDFWVTTVNQQLIISFKIPI
jgi:signal transduction histidine kinase